ncbi:MAG: uroporphyrinogen decarboxylase family protein [bacterium]
MKRANGPARKIHERDRMTAEERLATVVRLEEPDRVPVSMMIYYYGPFHTGARMSEYMRRPSVYRQVSRKVYEDLGPWDLYYNINPISRLLYSFALLMKYLYPGDELPDDVMAQVQEIENMSPEDYDRILDGGFYFSDLAFRLRMLPRFCKEARDGRPVKLWPRLARDIVRQKLFWDRDLRWCREKGMVMQIGFQAEMPFDVFSMARTIVPFSLDLFQRPDKIRRAALRLAPSFAEFCIWLARLMGVPRVQCYCHRTSNSFISPRQFEELAFPSLESVVCRIVEAGMTPILHCDGDWMKNFKTLRRLPAKKIILQLDGLTDIFRAKEEIGDHMCLFGDVPADKLVMAGVQEVDEYCHRLIEEVGRGGGFILAAGCEVPFNARPENLRALVQSAWKHGYYA